MTAINFPASPSLNDTYDVNGIQYTWDGTKWTASVSSPVNSTYLSTTGGTMTGDLGVTSLNSLDFPDADGSAGQSIITDGAGNLSFGVGTTVNTSGPFDLSGVTGIAFTGIQAGETKIKIALYGLQPAGTQGFIVRVRANSADVTSGYYAVGSYTGPTLVGSTVAQTTLFPVVDAQSGATYDGIFTLAKATGNKWVADWQISSSGGATEPLISWGAGSVDLGEDVLSGVLVGNAAGIFTSGLFSVIQES